MNVSPRGLADLPSVSTPAPVNFLRWSRSQHKFWNEQAARLGPEYRLAMPKWGDTAVLTGAEAARQVLKLAPDVAHAGEAYATVLTQSSGMHSVIVLDEADHLRMRKLILSPLHGQQLAHWEDFAEQRTLDEVRKLPLNEPVSLRPVFERITMSVISKIVFGMRDPVRGDELRRLLPALFKLSRPVGIGYISRIGRIDFGPWSPWGAFRRKRDRIDELIYAEIHERRAEAAAEGERSDLLSMLLDARDEDGCGMNDVELRDQLVTMLVAGHETTATSTAWAVERLVRTPDAMSRLVGEVDAGGTEYLDAVIKETMRVRPVVAQIGRILTKETEIDGCVLPAGTMIIIPMTVIHRNPDLYPDPRQFRPERFLNEDPGGYTWLPFGGGVRRCPGASLALLEMRVVLRTIFRNVTLSADRPEPEGPVTRGITTIPDRDGRVVLTARRSSDMEARTDQGVAA